MCQTKRNVSKIIELADNKIICLLFQIRSRYLCPFFDTINLGICRQRSSATAYSRKKAANSQSTTEQLLNSPSIIDAKSLKLSVFTWILETVVILSKTKGPI